MDNQAEWSAQTGGLGATELGEVVDALGAVLADLENLDFAAVRGADSRTQESELRELNIVIGRLLSFRAEVQQHMHAA